MAQIAPYDAMTTITPATTPVSQKLGIVTQPDATGAVVPTPESNVPRGTEPSKQLDSERFAALSRKERQLLRQRRDLQQQQKTLADQYKPWQEAAELAKVNKLQAIEKLGITYDDLTNLALGSGHTPEQLAELKAKEIVQREIQQLREEQSKLQQQQQQQAISTARSQISTEAKTLAETTPDFPLVKAIKGFDTITALVEQTYYQTGNIIPVEEATKEYENFLKEEVLQLAKLDPIKNEILKMVQPQAVQKTTPPSAVQQKPQTLTHKAIAPIPSVAAMTPEQRRQRAIDVFYGRTV